MKNIIYAMMHGLESALGFTRCNPLEVPAGHHHFRGVEKMIKQRNQGKKPRHIARSHPWQRRKRRDDQ